MATIQVRDIPQDVYDTIRSRAEAEGLSLQQFMRQQVIDLARRASKRDAIDQLERLLAERGGIEMTATEAVEAIHEGRRERDERLDRLR